MAPKPSLSTFPVGVYRSTQRKPTTFGRALTIPFSHEDWVWVHIKMNLAGDQTRNLRGETQVVWSLHHYFLLEAKLHLGYLPDRKAKLTLSYQCGNSENLKSSPSPPHKYSCWNHFKEVTPALTTLWLIQIYDTYYQKATTVCQLLIGIIFYLNATGPYALNLKSL